MLDYADFPFSEQFFTIERLTTESDGKIRLETVHCVTSLKAEEASAKRLLELNRGHWEIENRVHYVRDVTYDEDRCRIRTHNGPRVMASMRNLVIRIFRLLGFSYIPDGIRYFGYNRELEETLAIVGV